MHDLEYLELELNGLVPFINNDHFKKSITVSAASLLFLPRSISRAETVTPGIYTVRLYMGIIYRFLFHVHAFT